jgi:hypothetical protein
MRERADFSPLQEIVKNDYALDCLDIFFAKLYKGGRAPGAYKARFAA